MSMSVLLPELTMRASLLFMMSCPAASRRRRRGADQGARSPKRRRPGRPEPKTKPGGTLSIRPDWPRSEVKRPGTKTLTWVKPALFRPQPEGDKLKAHRLRSANPAAQPAYRLEMLRMIAGEAQDEVADPGIDPAPEPGSGAFGRPGISRLPRPHLGGRAAVVTLHEGVQALFGMRLVIVDRQRQIDRAGQLRRVAPGLARKLVDLPPLLAPFPRIGRIREPAVIEPPDAFEAGAHHAPNPDRRSAGTVRGRAEHRLFHDPTAVPIDRLAAPQFPAEAPALHPAAAPLLET